MADQFGKDRVKLHPDLERLLGALAVINIQWEAIEREWIGRRVRLLEDVINLKEPPGRQVYARAGEEGTIARVRHSLNTPFEIRFDGGGFSIATLLEKLEILPPNDP